MAAQRSHPRPSDNALTLPLQDPREHPARCETPQHRGTPIRKVEAALKCRSCKKGRYAPLVHMIKLTESREITPYPWVHPDDDDRR
jgi:hypothetical protein